MRAFGENSGHKEATRVTIRLALWTLVWTGTLALAIFGPELLWSDVPVLSGVAVALNLAGGVGWIVAYARYLRGIDEFQRKLNLDALAVTLGAGFVVGFAYLAAETAGLLTYDLSIALFPTFLAAVYLVTIAIGWIRYR